MSISKKSTIALIDPSRSTILASLTGYKDFTVPLNRAQQVPHGRTIAITGLRVLKKYPTTLPHDYHDLLTRFFSEVANRHCELMFNNPDQPFFGYGTESEIIRAFYDPQSKFDDSPHHFDSARIFLLSGIHTLSTRTIRGKKVFLTNTAEQILKKTFTDDALNRLHEVFITPGPTHETTAKEIAESMGASKGSRYSLTIATLTQRTPTRPTKASLPPPLLRPQPKSGNRIRKKKFLDYSQVKEETPEGLPEEDVLPDDLAIPVEERPNEPDEGSYNPSEIHPKRVRIQLAVQDARLRLVDGLLPDTEITLTSEEAKTFFNHLQKQVNEASRKDCFDENFLIDVVLALMLITARDQGTIIAALSSYCGGELPSSNAHNINMSFTDTTWLSFPELPFPKKKPEDWACQHQSHIELPLPNPFYQRLLEIKRKIRDPLANCTEQGFEERIKYWRKNSIPRLTLNRLRVTMPVMLYCTTGHPRTAQLVLGTDGFRSAAPTHYYGPDQERIRHQYSKALSHIVQGSSPPRMILEEGIRVGAPLAAIDTNRLKTCIYAATERTALLDQRSPNLGPLVQLYNHIAQHTALFFTALCAHRTTQSIGEMTLNQFIQFQPSGNGAALFSDKVLIRQQYRLAALPQVFFRQLSYYLMLTDRVVQRLEPVSENARNTRRILNQVGKGSSPLWAIIEPETLALKPMSRYILTKYCEGIGISIGQLRHHFATTAEFFDLSGADIAQQMGHRIDFTPYGPDDPDCPREFSERVSTGLEGYAHFIGLKLICTERTPEYLAEQNNLCVAPKEILKSAKSNQIITNSELHINDNGDDKKSLELVDRGSLIQQEHLDAYRLISALEIQLAHYISSNLNAHADTAIASNGSITAAKILLAIWGLTSRTNRLDEVIAESSLYKISKNDSVAVLFDSSRDWAKGTQLVPGAQAAILYWVARNSADKSDSQGIYELLTQHAIRKLLPGKVNLDDVLHIVGLARQMTTSGQRSAWERGDLQATGLRPDRLVALLHNAHVKTSRLIASTIPKAITSHGFVKEEVTNLYRELRYSLYQCKQGRPTSKKRDHTSSKAKKLIHSTPPYSLANMAAIAVFYDLTDSTRREPSSTYSYLTSFSSYIERSICEMSEHIDPGETSRNLLSEWVLNRKSGQLSSKKMDNKFAPLFWLTANQGKDLLPDLLELTDLAEYPIGERAGDPIGADEAQWLIQFTTQSIKAQSYDLNTDIPNPGSVIALALALQQKHALRTSELAFLTIRDWRLTPTKSEINIHSRALRHLKSTASKRVSVSQLTTQEYQELIKLFERVHPVAGRSHSEALRHIDLFPQSLSVPVHRRISQIQEWHRDIRRSLCGNSRPFRLHSHRHSLATGWSVAIQPDAFTGLDLSLPAQIPGYIKNLPLRAQYRYLSRQLGHGHPLTTLCHYDHSIPLMTITCAGWRGPDITLIAAIQGRKKRSLEQSVRRAKDSQGLDIQALRHIKLDLMEDQYELCHFPDLNECGWRPEEWATRETGHNKLLMDIANCAILMREGKDIETISAILDISRGDANRLYVTLQQVAGDLSLSFFKKPVMKRRSRLRKVSLPILEGLSKLKLREIVHIYNGYAKGRDTGDSRVREIISGGSALPLQGSLGEETVNLTRIVICALLRLYQQ
ncbi:hypothetical protein LRB11_15440 [Ectothiorhodospira haloalkaliphila]|uniref:hypothetical protein n=1 Tax=Ectothiorhodospira haloalkaliphila TaxID=421628 RepID=UPI001EE9A448|nr:hypothetical protein [Ectothiorhodospira haloalkaliphila]MCG5526308.1 hypothetical protein [Ectothiorhodospira haloalkaliphila]